MRGMILLLLVACVPHVAADDLPAQSSEKDSFNVAKTFAEALTTQLRQFAFPPLVAAVALIFGLVLLFNGLKSFKWTVTFACAITFGIVARAAAGSHFHDDKSAVANTVANVVGFEAALLVGAIAHIGHKGIMVFLGAAVGFFVAHLVSEFVVVNFHSVLMSQVEVMIFWYSVCSLVGSCWMYHDKHEKIMAFLSPIPGGIFTASALLYFATEAFVAFSCDHDNVKQMWQSEGAHCPNDLTPKVAPWVDFFLLGFSKMQSATGEEDVGIFYNTTLNMKRGEWSAGNQQAQGYAILYDHLLTLGLWFVLTVLGIKVQRCVSKRKGTQLEESNRATQHNREEDERKEEKKKEEKKKEAAREVQQKPESKVENKEAPVPPVPSKSKWPFGGKKESKVSQLEQGLIENGKGA